MALFSRKESSGNTGRRTSARTSSEAQAAELRVRARRRLIGALVLVLTAVIFVPMLFDSPPEEELSAPVVLPDSIAPMPQEPQVALAPEPAGPASDSGMIQQPQPVEATPSAPAEVPATESEPEASSAPQAKPAEAPAAPAAGEEPKPAPAKPAAQESARTDDGSVAMALLEGRQPAAPSSGNFVLQVAAYTTESDAQVRRDKLAAAGVTNAYVENAVANGKTAYRLRVGPFPTREAAEAAQARLRQLGYNNGLIFTK